MFFGLKQALEQNQEMLQGKIKDQEARRRQLEEELEEMRRKHAESEAQWKERMSSMNMESKDGERKERLDTRDVQGKLNCPAYYDKERVDKGEDQDTFISSYYDRKRRDRGEGRANVRTSYHDKEGKTRHRVSDESSQFDDARLGHKSQSSDLSYRDEIEGRHSRNRRHASDSSRHVDTEGRGRGRDDREESPRRGKTGSRKGHEKSERKSRKTRERNVEFETAIKKTEAEVTKVEVVRDDEVYRLSKGRIELLESEKSALMELNTSLQEENKALKQLALSLQKGTGEIS